MSSDQQSNTGFIGCHCNDHLTVAAAEVGHCPWVACVVAK